jgi:hypothetical protein
MLFMAATVWARIARRVTVLGCLAVRGASENAFFERVAPPVGVAKYHQDEAPMGSCDDVATRVAQFRAHEAKE